MGGSKSKSTTGPAFEKQRSQYGTELFQGSQGIGAKLLPSLYGEMNNPITPAERSALFETSMAPVASAFDAMEQNAAQRAARTRNPAGLLEADEELARAKGQGLSSAANKAELSALGIGDQRRQDALAELARMYGIDLDAMSRLLSGQQGTSSSSKGAGFGIGLPGGFGLRVG